MGVEGCCEGGESLGRQGRRDGVYCIARCCCCRVCVSRAVVFVGDSDESDAVLLGDVPVVDACQFEDRTAVAVAFVFKAHRAAVEVNLVAAHSPFGRFEALGLVDCCEIKTLLDTILRKKSKSLRITTYT